MAERAIFSCRFLPLQTTESRNVDCDFVWAWLAPASSPASSPSCSGSTPTSATSCVTDLLPERADELAGSEQLAGHSRRASTTLLASDVDAIALFTQRWTHGPLAVRALRAGKHVYSAVPMAVSVEEIAAIIDAVGETGLVYMMGETSYYNPATVFARQKLAEGAFGRRVLRRGRLRARHGSRLLRRLRVQRRGGLEVHRQLSADDVSDALRRRRARRLGETHAVSVSCLGVPDQRGDGVFDK